MKPMKSCLTLLATFFLVLFLFTACGDSAGEDQTDGDANDIPCTTDSDCITGTNSTCNLIASVCIDHGDCTSDTECEAWYGSSKPFCNAGACELYDNSDGDVDVDQTDNESAEGCTDFSGFYLGEFNCTTNETFDTWVVVDDYSCAISIFYNGQFIEGQVTNNAIITSSGKSCSGSGQQYGDINLTCNDSCTIKLTKSTIENKSGDIKVQHSKLDFNAVNTGDTKKLSTAISNYGEGTLTIGAIFLTDDTSREFEIVNSDGTWDTPKEMNYTEEDDLVIAYTPTDDEGKKGLLVIFSDDKNEPVIKIALQSEEKARPNIEVEPGAVDFGASAPGFDNLRYFLIKSTGKTSAQVTNIEITDDRSGAFTLKLDPESMPPFSLESGYSKSVNLNFNPVEGVHNEHDRLVGKACITWKDTDQVDQFTCLDLLGLVTKLQPACISMQPLEGSPGIWGMGDFPGPGLKFGNSQINSCWPRDMVISNCGDLALEITNMAWSMCEFPGTGRSFFEDMGSFRNYTINRGEKVYIPISYCPMQEGQMDTSCLMFTANAENFEWLGGPQPPDTPPEFKGLVTVGLSGFGARRGIEVLPSKLDFGLITLECCSREEEITVYNIGNLILDIADIIIGDGSDDTFELVDLPPASDFPLHLGGETYPQSLRFKVKFCPSKEGDHVGRVEIKSNDANNSEMIIPLKGAGTLLSHQIDEFEQNTHPQVDVLWAIDCSGSMGGEQDKVKEQTELFVRTAVEWNVEMNLALVSADITTQSGHKGLMQGNPAVLKNYGPDALSNDEIISKFRDRVKFPNGCDNGEQEAGLEGAHLALSEPLISNENAGFFREDAKLSIIFLSDEDDQSVGEIPFFIDFFRSQHGMRNLNMIEIYAIVGDKPDGCSTGTGDTAESAGAGPRYIAVADACNVHDDIHFYSICSETYEPVFNTMSENLFALKNQFFLSRLANPATIVVTLDGVPNHDWEYDEASNAIIFPQDDPPAPGVKIVVEYDTVCLH